MRKVLAVLLVLLVPFVAAHVDEADDAHNTTNHVDAQLGPGAQGANDFSRVNPFVLAGEGRWSSALVFGAVWAGLLVGVWQLVKLVFVRLIEFE